MNEVASKTALTDWVCHTLKREGRWLLKWGASIETEKMYEYMLVLDDTIFFWSVYIHMGNKNRKYLKLKSLK